MESAGCAHPAETIRTRFYPGWLVDTSFHPLNQEQREGRIAGGGEKGCVRQLLFFAVKLGTRPGGYGYIAVRCIIHL